MLRVILKVSCNVPCGKANPGSKDFIAETFCPGVSQYLADHYLYEGQNPDLAFMNETTGKLGRTNPKACFGTGVIFAEIVHREVVLTLI
jgi:hypothetical protein